MKLLALVASLSLVGCLSTDDPGPTEPPPTEPPPPEPPPGPNAACDPAVRAAKIVEVTGRVVDFATGAGVPGASVDIGTGWDGTEVDCPVLATVTTGADGTFGPIEVEAGSYFNPGFVVLRVHGGDRARTISDARTCAEARCTVVHEIAAPSAALAAAWRTELAAGGMPDAATRGLVAFEFREAGAGAAGVSVHEVLIFDPPRRLARGTEVRFVDTDRETVLGVSQPTTVASGLALIGATRDPAIHVGGTRNGVAWESTGCLVEDGAIFVEDRSR